MQSKQKGYTAVELLLIVWALMLAVGAWGWVWNIVRLVNYVRADVVNEMIVHAIVRGVGVVLFPLGAVIGFIPF